MYHKNNQWMELDNYEFPHEIGVTAMKIIGRLSSIVADAKRT